MEQVEITPTRYYMLVEDWQGAQVYDEFVLEEVVYWPFGGHA